MSSHMTNLSRRKLLVGASLLTGSLGLARAAVGTQFTDPVSTPARSSALAPRAPVFALSRAGQRWVAAGARGHILCSDDAGAHWQQKPVPVSVDLVALSFADAQNGWAVGHGGVVLHSNDGGNTWAVQRSKARDEPFLGAYFWSARSGVIVGTFGRLLRTNDGGKTWDDAKANYENPDELHLNAVAGNGEMLYVVGEQGKVWSLNLSASDNVLKSVPTPYAGTLFGVLVTSNSTVLAYGMRGSLYRSVDAGKSWAQVASGTQAGITSATRLDDGRVVLTDQGGGLAVSRDDGQSFARVRVQSPTPFFSVAPGAAGSVILGGALGLNIQTLS